MTPETLQALRRLLFFSRQEASDLVPLHAGRPAGVSDRTWRMWEDGSRSVPGDIAAAIIDLVRWRNQAIAAARATLSDAQGAAGSMGLRAIIVWYATEHEWTCAGHDQPTGTAARGLVYWRPHQSMTAELAATLPSCRLAPFDRADYFAWLSDQTDRTDSAAARSEWAAQKKSGVFGSFGG